MARDKRPRTRAAEGISESLRETERGAHKCAHAHETKKGAHAHDTFMVNASSLNMDSTWSFEPGPPAVRSISRVEKASPSAGFSYDACRLGVSWSQTQSRRLSD